MSYVSREIHTKTVLLNRFYYTFRCYCHSPQKQISCWFLCRLNVVLSGFMTSYFFRIVLIHFVDFEFLFYFTLRAYLLCLYQFQLIGDCYSFFVTLSSSSTANLYR